MFNFFKKSKEKKAKKSNEVNSNKIEQLDEEPVETNVENTFKPVDTPPIADDYETEVFEDFSDDFALARSVVQQIKKIKRYSQMGQELANELNRHNKKEFKKANLVPFLTSAEDYVNAENTNLQTLTQKVNELQETIYAIEDIRRINTLIADSNANIPSLTKSLKEVKTKIGSIKEDTEIIQVVPEFTKAYDYIKEISYALKFTFDRLEYLADKDTQSDSIKFYSKQYNDFNTVYGGLSAKLTSLDEQSRILTQKLELYTKKIQMSKSQGLLNIDLDGKKRAALVKMRAELTEGYEQFDSSCLMIVKSAVTVIENLINANSELSGYLTTLCPKLKKNAEMMDSRYNAYQEDLTKQKLEVEGMTNDLIELITIFKKLYE